MTKYKCGHSTTAIFVNNNDSIFKAYHQWKKSVGFEGDKSLCWDCWCKDICTEHDGNFEGIMVTEALAKKDCPYCRADKLEKKLEAYKKETTSAAELLRLAGCLDDIDNDIAEMVLTATKKLGKKEVHSQSDLMYAMQEIKDKLKRGTA